ncbi:MAG: S9 family peptidase [Prevotellaceae bacterium]|jgi:dipeptidyl-peptidase-4|nr:S9 family peptidase [Prevotellaceae bacterium]
MLDTAKKIILTLVTVSCFIIGTAQNKILSMEEAVLGYHLYPESKNFVWQGNNYTYIEAGNLVGEDMKGVKKTVLTADELNNIINSQFKTFPPFSWIDANTLRVNHKGKEYRINVTEKILTSTAVLPENAEHITPSPNRKYYACTIDNNLYCADEQGNSFAISNDGDKNIVNGQTVSRNEFGIDGGIFWSPDSKKIAFYRKDESKVSSFPLLDISTRTGSLKEIKYPMAGMASEQISVGVFDIASKRTVFLETDGFDSEKYLTNITWSPASDFIYIQELNRGQNHIRLNRYNAVSGKFSAMLFEEKSDTYIEPAHTLKFIDEKGDRFIYTTNNRDGYQSLYLHSASDGKLIKRLTPTAADVEFLSIDRAGKYLYYLSSEVSPIERHLFKLDLKTGKTVRLTAGEGWHNISLNGDCSYFTDSYSSLKNPRIIELVSTNGKTVRRLFEAKNPLSEYADCEVSTGTLKADDNSDLYYRLVKPANFDSTKKYPVIQYVYGGPHSQLVKNSWRASSSLWETYMAQHGYLVFVMDNHGTSNRGRAFENIIHRRLGQYEMADQVKGTEFIKSKPYVDTGKIGLHGWSFGGFMTVSLMTTYPDLYKTAVAGGPVIDWKWYEVMYGERYMDTPEENVEGYSKTSLINKAKNLKGKLLICHGLIDPVVVIEHSLAFISECIKNNISVDYFVYPLSEHNVGGRDRVHLMQKITDYFDDYMK